MKLSTKVKTLSAAVALTAAGAASATPFYLDLGVDYDTNATRSLSQVCPTCTAMKQELVYQYDSRTFIGDVNGSGTINAGDSVSTDVGLSVGGFTPVGLGTNAVSNFNPIQTLFSSNNGLGNDWDISFSATGLAGTVVGVTGGGVPLFSYGPGLLQMYITFDSGVTYNNFMDLKISGGATTGVGTVLVGEIDFTSVDAGFNNLFHSGDKTCGGLSGFFDIWSGCGPASLSPMLMQWASSQDTNVLVSAFTAAPGGFRVTSNHNGSLAFNIPEPSSLMLLGVALLGLGSTAGRRNRKDA